MFDLARAAAIAWAIFAAARARAWIGASLVGLVAYVVALEVASGIAVRDEGPQQPMMAMLLIFVGPSGMPRGHLPAIPLASLVVGRPAWVDAVACVALAIPMRALSRRAARTPNFDPALPRLDRAGLALMLLVVLQAISAALRLLPDLLMRDF